MKYLILSDIHGSKFYFNKILEIFKNEKFDKMIIVGDLYYHGPRNPLTEEYDPMYIATKLNEIKDKIVVIKGNCDAVVDEMISEFKFHDKYILELANKKIFFTHGHIYNMDSLPEEEFDIMIYGHLHTHFIQEEYGKIFINTGSISLPKNNTKNSYVVLDGNIIKIKDFESNCIDKIEK